MTSAETGHDRDQVMAIHETVVVVQEASGTIRHLRFPVEVATWQAEVHDASGARRQQVTPVVMQAHDPHDLRACMAEPGAHVATAEEVDRYTTYWNTYWDIREQLEQQAGDEATAMTQAELQEVSDRRACWEVAKMLHCQYPGTRLHPRPQD